MGLFSKIFGEKNESESTLSLGYTTELHNHLIPTIDDGVKTFDESLEVINALCQLGIKRIITTPHIKSDIFPNTEEKIISAAEEFKMQLAQHSKIQLEASAEYFLDEKFVQKIQSEKKLLSFGEGHILFETSHVFQSPFFGEVVFLLKSQGYVPIFAHPERYQYTFADFSMLEKMYESGVYFQMNINSLGGYYGKEPQKNAERLVESGMVDFVGTDAHGMRHITILEKSIQTKSYQKLLASDRILNDTI